MKIREKIINDAKTAICKDREESHGDANTQLTQTGYLWGVYFHNKFGIALNAISAKDVAMCNILQKISRSTFNEKHEDHYTDIVGYAALAGEFVSKNKGEENEDDRK